MYTEYQQEKISAFLFETGHAHPRFIGKHVVYRDQTRGFYAMDKLIDGQVILEVVEHLSLLDIEKLVKRAAYAQMGVTFTNFVMLSIYNSGQPDYENWTNNPAIIIEKIKEPDPFAVFRSGSYYE